jgi:hypothetical protein
MTDHAFCQALANEAVAAAVPFLTQAEGWTVHPSPPSFVFSTTMSNGRPVTKSEGVVAKPFDVTRNYLSANVHLLRKRHSPQTVSNEKLQVFEDHSYIAKEVLAAGGMETIQYKYITMRPAETGVYLVVKSVVDADHPSGKADINFIVYHLRPSGDGTAFTMVGSVSFDPTAPQEITREVIAGAHAFLDGTISEILASA